MTTGFVRSAPGAAVLDGKDTWTFASVRSVAYAVPSPPTAANGWFDPTATLNLRLAVVRRVAYEAADASLLSPELAAGIRQVKGVGRIGVRLGTWLTPQQGRQLLECATPSIARELRDHAIVATLIGCRLRRAELLALTVEAIQQREAHSVIADLSARVATCARCRSRRA